MKKCVWNYGNIGGIWLGKICLKRGSIMEVGVLSRIGVIEWMSRVKVKIRLGSSGE